MKRFNFVLGVIFALVLAPASFAQVVINPGGGSSGGGITSGAAATGCSIYSLVYVDASGNLACAKAPINGATSTAATAITQINETISGSSATSNWLNITGTFPATLSAATSGAVLSFTGDNDAQQQEGLSATLTGAGANAVNHAIGGYSAGTHINSSNVAVYGENGSIGGSGWSVGVGGLGQHSTASKYLAGVVGLASPVNSNGTMTLGGWFVGGGGSGTTTNIFGIVGGALSTGTNGLGGLFYLSSTINQNPFTQYPSTYVTSTGKAALVADNTSVAANIFEARDNGTPTSTTAASANVTILDGAQMRLGNQVLTSATMTPTIVGEARTVTHSYAWTNAMVVALGATTAGDITVATLPAKTQVNNAYVVIDTAAAGVTTLTVSCGDAIGGTPFINYIVASDAKAAANTVYGDAVAERGTSIDTEFYYLPSYTATTLVTCHFISTGANLSAVTTSTGRLILTTTLLP